jgi:hypothetical protein
MLGKVGEGKVPLTAESVISVAIFNLCLPLSFCWGSFLQTNTFASNGLNN